MPYFFIFNPVNLANLVNPVYCLLFFFSLFLKVDLRYFPYIAT